MLRSVHDLYAAAVAISLPGVAILHDSRGYLFGWLHGTVLVLIAAAAGASGVFLLTRSALGDHVRERTAPALQRFAEGFRRHALSYGFALNVVPIFPYALIIVVPAACGVPLHTFLAGMFLGLVPGTVVFAGLGDRLGEMLARDVPPRLNSFITPEIVLSLSGLAVLARCRWSIKPGDAAHKRDRLNPPPASARDVLTRPTDWAIAIVRLSRSGSLP